MTDRAEQPSDASMIQLALKITGAAAVIVGVLGIGFGSFWASETLQFFDSTTIGRALELLVPFLPISLIMFGAFLLVKSRQ